MMLRGHVTCVRVCVFQHQMLNTRTGSRRCFTWRTIWRCGEERRSSAPLTWSPMRKTLWVRFSVMLLMRSVRCGITTTNATSVLLYYLSLCSCHVLAYDPPLHPPLPDTHLSFLSSLWPAARLGLYVRAGFQGAAVRSGHIPRLPDALGPTGRRRCPAQHHRETEALPHPETDKGPGRRTKHTRPPGDDVAIVNRVFWESRKLLVHTVKQTWMYHQQAEVRNIFSPWWLLSMCVLVRLEWRDLLCFVSFHLDLELMEG